MKLVLGREIPTPKYYNATVVLTRAERDEKLAEGLKKKYSALDGLNFQKVSYSGSGGEATVKFHFCHSGH